MIDLAVRCSAISENCQQLSKLPKLLSGPIQVPDRCGVRLKERHQLYYSGQLVISYYLILYPTILLQYSNILQYSIAQYCNVVQQYSIVLVQFSTLVQYSAIWYYSTCILFTLRFPHTKSSRGVSNIGGVTSKYWS